MAKRSSGKQRGKATKVARSKAGIKLSRREGGKPRTSSTGPKAKVRRTKRH